MPKILKTHLDSLTEGLQLALNATADALKHLDATTASNAWKACKSYTNRYEGRVMKLKRPKPKPKSKKVTPK